MKIHHFPRIHTPLLAFVTTYLLTTGTIQAEAKTYRWVDEHGNTVYSQLPPQARDYQELKLRNKTPEDQRAVATEKLQRMQQQTAKTRKKQASEAIRKKNCQTARDNLKILENPEIRLLKDQEGNYETLDDNRRKTLIKETQENINEFCNNKKSQ